SRWTKPSLDFSAVGHFASILIGLLFYPMARERDGRLWNPARIKSLLHRRGTRGRRA
ncbi:LOW QUALITY PROTEIN: conserved membrane protein, partial [Mycobacterium tuberculosis '98-R604 INH-RIF-EM']